MQIEGSNSLGKIRGNLLKDKNIEEVKEKDENHKNNDLKTYLEPNFPKNELKKTKYQDYLLSDEDLLSSEKKSYLNQEY